MSESGSAWGGPGAAPPQHAPRWYACYTQARQEKKVEARLRERGIESFLPLVPRIRQWHDRRKVVEFPLFPSYVFGRFPLSAYHRVLAVPGLSTVVRLNGHPAPISDEEIANVARFAEALAATGMDPEPVPFREGQRVRIAEGPFAGVEGIVLEARGRRRVLVGLRTIGVGFEIDISADALRTLP
jgi:transcription antitermination factor NusG